MWITMWISRYTYPHFPHKKSCPQFLHTYPHTYPHFYVDNFLREIKGLQPSTFLKLCIPELKP